jgi:hypothetical protein
VAKSERNYPRPLGGPEPSVQGVDPNVPDSDANLNPGYDYSGSIPGCSRTDLRNGYRDRERIPDDMGDGMEGA